jgi:hypothetical protein
VDSKCRAFVRLVDIPPSLIDSGIMPFSNKRCSAMRCGLGQRSYIDCDVEARKGVRVDLFLYDSERRP